ncbi:aluminum-activated malate transporter 10-like [Canna indica]|uniref:Aluminum-activated malate transporter 10-like n=1 Tax=Canna indica TaxID=4628 RepID=A0AAQ3QE19_9LILI|nr:aluminum-activated malate transporter 10-like [Canna indica]WOL07530.1 aluminum-activated malate transporter 10-like [Canna indica]
MSQVHASKVSSHHCASSWSTLSIGPYLITVHFHYHLSTAIYMTSASPVVYKTQQELTCTQQYALYSVDTGEYFSIEMATKIEASGIGGLEWRVTVPEGSTAKVEPESSWSHRVRDRLDEFASKLKSKLSSSGKKIWKLGKDDPRKVTHGVKVGLALTLVSIFYYAQPLYNGFGSSAMWAVMTVVVVFEYTVGGCFYKGINRAIATLTAGGLAVGIHWVATKSGEKVEPLILSASVFILASAATFSRFIPTVKSRCDYGVTIFILTFSMVAVSGYRVDELADLAMQRMSTIAIGIGIAVIVCVLVYPVWSGYELQFLISVNMAKLADSLEGCVEDYFEKNEIVDEKESSSSKSSDGYKCVLNSKATEESHANLARWEPPHGRFGFRHPWQQYIKVGASVRYCAYCVEALHSCINSEVKAPECLKKHLRDPCMKLSKDSSKVLKELSSCINLMNRSPSIDLLLGDMNNAVQELHDALRSLPHQLFTQSTPPKPIEPSDEEGKKKSNSSAAAAALPLIEFMPLMTTATLLIETSARIQGVVDAVATLANVASFKSSRNEKSTAKVQDEGQEVAGLQEV